MSLKDEVNSAISNRLDELKMSQTDFSKASGMSPQYVSQLLKGGYRRWNLDRLEKALSALGIKIIFKVGKRVK